MLAPSPVGDGVGVFRPQLPTVSKLFYAFSHPETPIIPFNPPCFFSRTLCKSSEFYYNTSLYISPTIPPSRYPPEDLPSNPARIPKKFVMVISLTRTPFDLKSYYSRYRYFSINLATIKSLGILSSLIGSFTTGFYPVCHFLRITYQWLTT